MTMSEIEAVEDDVLCADDIAEILGVKPQSIREQAKNDKNQLGFATIRIGNKLLIPRLAFIKYMKGNTK